MTQYIDKSTVVAEIERRMEINNTCQKISGGNEFYRGAIDEAKEILSFINILEVKEVDLENELKEDWLFADKTEVDCLDCMCLTEDMFVSLAKKYFKLGLSVSNSAKVTTPDIDDVLKENGVNPDSKEAKIIKESYFMAIEKLTQKGE